MENDNRNKSNGKFKTVLLILVGITILGALSLASERLLQNAAIKFVENGYPARLYSKHIQEAYKITLPSDAKGISVTGSGGMFQIIGSELTFESSLSET